ncbi:MAG: PKD domain-containing protein [Bacteroidia bacterium]|nr:PKD domain-containing protein [Bacteroidia bacterium]
MRSVYLLLLSLLLPVAAWAQIPPVWIGGEVTALQGNLPVPHHPVNITLSGPGFTLSSSVMTDSTGHFADTLQPPVGFNAGTAIVTTADCNGSVVTDSALVTSGNPGAYFTLNICPNLNACAAAFGVSLAPSAPLDVQFLNFSVAGDPTVPLQFQWSFGDGTSSVDFEPLHTFPAPGIYTICLTISNGSGCTDQFCVPVQVGSLQGNCSAYFTSIQGSSPYVYYFQVDSSSYLPGATYIWDFGDSSGIAYGGPGILHMFPSAGFYPVCLTVIDSANFCQDTYCDAVFVIDSTSACDAQFSVQTDGLHAIFHPFTFLPTSSYSWDFGDGNTAFGAGGAFHLYPSYGTYTACLIVSDSLFGCSDTVCQQITVAPPACVADFTWSIDSTGLAAFTNLSATANPATTVYYWYFSDSTISTDANPVHQFVGTGPWSACLIVSDTSNGCTAADCAVLDLNSQLLTISGAVVYDSLSQFISPMGTAYLIKYDSLAGTLSMVDSTDFFLYYSFDNVVPGDYLVKAVLSPQDPFYANYMPTYLGDVLFWYEATGVVVTNAHVTVPFIQLIPGNNPGGPGFIGGLVGQGANKTGNTGIGNVSVMLMHQSGEAAAYTFTHNDGTYSFDNLAYGTYTLHVEMAGRYSDAITVTLSPQTPSAEGQDFEVKEHTVVAATTSIGELAGGRLLGIYPNPAGSRASVELSLDQPAAISLSILSLNGQILQRMEAGSRIGEVAIPLDLSSLPDGVYLVEIRSGDTRTVTRLMKGL